MCDHADDEKILKTMSIAIDSLKKGKSAESKGIKAEDLKGADEETSKMIHEVFST